MCVPTIVGGDLELATPYEGLHGNSPKRII